MSAARVNCGTSSKSPWICVRLKFIFPAASAKYAILQQAIEQPQGGGLVIGGAHAHQDQESRADGRRPAGRQFDLGLRNALQ